MRTVSAHTDLCHTMFRHKGALISTSVVLLVLATAQAQSNSRSYDTNDWIPVSRSCPTCFQNEDTQSDGVQKRPTGRVLNLPTTDQKRFFPPEQSDSSSQSYNIPLKQQEEKQQPQQQARLLQNQGQYPQQQIVLPPQLQSLINQGQPFLSPQRINNQLLQAPNGVSYQPTLQTVPQFALNSTQFNSRDVVQNINLGLYNQQSTKQQPQITQSPNVKPNGNSDREEVQLLYVPLENLRPNGQRQQIAFPNEQRLPTPQAYNQPTVQQYQPVQHKQAQLQNIQQDFVQQALQAQKLQEQFQHNVSPVPQQNFRRPYVPDPITHEPTTTSAPKKRKPHQPPLAVYMGTEGHSEIKLGDVLTLLKDAKTISVQDNIGPDAPQVFVGPSHLAPPDGYVKFDLPYLSSIESNRVERKVDQLPFFVAPLSYKAPPGYSKIPFPAPHVGSVVINHIQAGSQEQTTTENVQPFLNQNIQETSNHTPYSSAEITTVRTRGRQRQPSRASYTASTVQTPVTPQIPYGPLPTKVSSSAEQHSVQESLISPNPYGPTQFVQSTTPSIYENPASLPPQIFSTKNRFSTPNTNYNIHNVQSIPEKHTQFVQQIQQEVESTEHTPLATTLSDVISNEKYTVLEQFPLPEKSSSNKYSQSNVAQNTGQRIPSRHYSRGRPTENYYNDESKTETSLPLVSNEQYSNEQYLVDAPVKSPYLQNQQEIPVPQYVTQTVPAQQIPLEHYSQDTKKPTTQEPLVQHQYVHQEIPTKDIPLEHYSHQQQQQQHIVQESPVQSYSAERLHQDDILVNQQYSTEQTSAEYEKPVRQSRPHSRVRGKQHFTPEPYYKPEYETPNVKETSTRHEPLLNQQVVQHQTPVYHSQELPVSTQATRGRGRPEHTPETYFNEDYVAQNINEAPVRHEVALNKQVNDQSAEYVAQETPLQKHQLQNTRGRDYDSQEISLQQVNPQVTRGRGKPQFTPETYGQEYEQHTVKPTEPEVHVSKKPIVDYEIPIMSTQKSIELSGRPQYDPEIYYRDVIEQPRVQEQQQQYTLPSQLPPISLHLPRLVNSLQDQAIRPLLAPLLLPPSEEPPVTEYTSEYYTTPSTTTTTTTTTTTSTTTPVPIVETTTPFKRTRGRQRGTRPTASYEYVNTTPTSHQRTSSYRGRRPYTRTRQQSHENSVPVSSTAQPEVVTETSTRAAFNRNRYVQRDRQYVSSTTEQPRRQPTNSRQRYRTRGRPVKTDEEYTARSTTDNVSVFKQPSLEGGFQESLPVDHSNVELPAQTPTNNPQFNIQNDPFLNQKQQEQALVYVQNSNKQIVSESSPIQISSEKYIPREHFISSTENVEPLHQTTIAASAPENNIVSDVLHNEPVVLVNHKINQQQSNYPNVEFNTNRNVEYNSNEEINVNTSRVKYNEEPEVRSQPTTESVRTRSRIRGRPRTRGYQSTSNSRYQASSPTTTTTTTQRTTTESEEEDQQEFYGFFRPPSFVKPIKMEYKQSSELRTAVNPAPTVAYLHSPSSEEQNIYVSPVSNPVYSTSASHLHVSQVDDSQADHNIRTQYVSSTPDIRTQYAPPAESSEEEEVVDIKPVTRRPASSFNRARRPIAPVKVEDQTEIPSPVTKKYYTVRPSKRPETRTPKVTRIRGRIRRPTRPTTVAPTIETESSYSGNEQQQVYSRTNELSNIHSDEYVAPVKPRQRITSRGKSHFQLPRNEKLTLEPESNNYPPSFLQAQQNHHQQAEATVNVPEISAQKSVNIVSAEQVHTAKPSFQLTIESEDGDEEYTDQVPYTSVNKHRIDINLDEGAESKYSAKVVAKPSNYNFIVTNEKNKENIDKTTEKPTSTETVDITTIENEPVVTETEEPPVRFQQLTTAFPEIDITQSLESTTTDVPTTLEPVTDTSQARRRGVWRLVKLRALGDDFESAESQNIGSVFNNNFDVEKPVWKYHSVKRVRTTTEEAQEEVTTVVPPKVVNNQQNDAPTPESDIFAPLYEMFGYTREGSIFDNGFDILPSDDDTGTTTMLPTVNNIYSDDVELTTLSNNNTTEVNQDFSSIKQDKIEMYSDRLGDKEAESSTDDSWRTRIIGTSTTTEISHETEICYRGRCVKSSSEESSERL